MSLAGTPADHRRPLPRSARWAGRYRPSRPARTLRRAAATSGSSPSRSGGRAPRSFGCPLKTLATTRSLSTTVFSRCGSSGPELPMHVVQPYPTVWKPRACPETALSPVLSRYSVTTREPGPERRFHGRANSSSLSRPPFLPAVPRPALPLGFARIGTRRDRRDHDITVAQIGERWFKLARPRPSLDSIGRRDGSASFRFPSIVAVSFDPIPGRDLLCMANPAARCRSPDRRRR